MAAYAVNNRGVDSRRDERARVEGTDLGGVRVAAGTIAGGGQVIGPPSIASSA
jgi:hypothetical protein